MKFLILSSLFFFLAVPQLSAQDAEAHFKSGEKACNSGNYEEAIGHLDKALQSDPNHVNALLKKSILV